MRFWKHLLPAATAAFLMVLLSVAGSAQAQTQRENDKQLYLYLSDPQLPDELVYEVVDDFTSRYSESLACWTDDCQHNHHAHQHGRHHSRPAACQKACQRATRPACTKAECRRTECATAHSCSMPQEYEAGWVAFADADDTAAGQVKVLCRRCQVPGCDFLEKEWEVTS